MKIAIIGKGHVGSALGTGLKRAGHDVKYGHRAPNARPYNVAEWGELVIIAVPYNQLGNVTMELKDAVDDKIVIDVTNCLDLHGDLALGFTTSGAEQLQKALPLAKVVKAFNTVFAQNQSTGRVGETRLSAFVAGDDVDAKQSVMSLASEIGFEPVDCGPLTSARFLEPMGMQLIQLGYGMQMGPSIGYRLIRG